MLSVIPLDDKLNLQSNAHKRLKPVRPFFIPQDGQIHVKFVKYEFMKKMN